MKQRAEIQWPIANTASKYSSTFKHLAVSFFLLSASAIKKTVTEINKNLTPSHTSKFSQKKMGKKNICRQGKCSMTKAAMMHLTFKFITLRNNPSLSSFFPQQHQILTKKTSSKLSKPTFGPISYSMIHNTSNFS